MSLFLTPGATLWFSPKEEHYKDGNRFLYAEDEANIKGLTVDHLRVLIPEDVYGKFPRAALSLHLTTSQSLLFCYTGFLPRYGY